MVKVVEKPQSPDTNLKGCGVYILNPRNFEAIRQTPCSPIRNEYELTDAISTLISSGHPIYPLEIIQWDMNISSVEDLFYCNFLWMISMGKDRLIGDNVQLHKGTSIEYSIVGDDVTINSPVHIDRCLLLGDQLFETPDSEVRSKIIYGGELLQVGADVL